MPSTEAAAGRLVAQWIGDMAFALGTLEDSEWADPEAGGLHGDARIRPPSGSWDARPAARPRSSLLRRSRARRGGVAMDAWMTPVTDRDAVGRRRQALPVPVQRTVADRENQPRFRPTAADQQPCGSGRERSSERVTTTSAICRRCRPSRPSWGFFKGPINGAHVQHIVNKYSLAFFDRVLKGKATTLRTVRQRPLREVVRPTEDGWRRPRARRRPPLAEPAQSRSQG